MLTPDSVNYDLLRKDANGMVHNSSVSGQNRRWSRPAFLIMPAIYVGTIAVTYTLSIGTPGGAYYRIFGLDPLAAIFGMVYDNAAIIIGVFLLTGTPWWYFVGRLTLAGKRRVFGGLLALFTFLIVISATLDPLKQDLHNGVLSSAVMFQYSLTALLCLGALTSAVYGLVVRGFLPSHD